MLSVAQAARVAGVGQTTVRGWVGRGQLPHFRLGAKGRRGAIRIAPADLDALLASFKVAVSPPGARAAPAPPPAPRAYRHLRLS